MLDVALGRQGPTPLDAATILCVRDAGGTLEILCVERHQKSKFLGGAVVFPGGKLDPKDRDPRLSSDTESALAVAACRECFEEAGLLFHRGAPVDEATRRAMRAALATGAAFADVLGERGLALDLAALVPFARWVTPVVETRRFDTRFYIARAPVDHDAVHDAHETTSAFWATPAAVLERFARGECSLFPPTHRSLELLATVSSVDDALALAARASRDIICPELVKHVDDRGETMALTLPGDPAHSVRATIVPGRSRYVLRGEQWLPEEAPA